MYYVKLQVLFHIYSYRFLRSRYNISDRFCVQNLQIKKYFSLLTVPYRGKHKRSMSH